MRFNLNGHASQSMTAYAGDDTVRQVGDMKLLGFFIDSSLKWDVHIDHLCARLGSACYALKRLASTATRDVVRSCYFATVHALISYGTELWAGAAEWRRVFTLQKRAVRAIAGVPDDVSARQYFTEYSVLTLPCVLIQQIAIFTYNNLDKFTTKQANANHHLRSNKDAGCLASVPHKLKKSGRSAYILGPRIYNHLPKSIRDAPSSHNFKIRLKKWLLTSQFYDLDEYFFRRNQYE